MASMLVRIQLTSFGYSWTPDPNGQPIVDGPPAGPVYLWTTFFKIDGDSASVGPNLQFQGKSTVAGMPGDHGDLVGTDLVGLGSSITYTIPAEIATWVTVLKPIPIANMTMTFPGLIGCVAVLMVQQETPDSAASAGHDALNNAIQQQLDGLIQNFGIMNPPTPQAISGSIKTIVSNVQSAVVNAMAKAQGLWISLLDVADLQHPDYQLMTAPFLFVQTALANVPAQGTPLQATQNFTVDFGYADQNETQSSSPGIYQLNGKITADPFPLSMKRVLIGRGDPPPIGLGSLLNGSVGTWLFTP